MGCFQVRSERFFFLGGDLGFADRVGDGVRRHLAVAVGRLACAVERVVPGLDPILPQDEGLVLAGQPADPADAVLYVVIADRLAPQEATAAIDVNIAHALRFPISGPATRGSSFKPAALLWRRNDVAVKFQLHTAVEIEPEGLVIWFTRRVRAPSSEEIRF
jgi:hypothetical protein